MYVVIKADTGSCVDHNLSLLLQPLHLAFANAISRKGHISSQDLDSRKAFRQVTVPFTECLMRRCDFIVLRRRTVVDLSPDKVKEWVAVEHLLYPFRP